MDGPPVEMLARIPLFAELEPGELERLRSYFEARDLGPDEVVVSEGERADGFYVIESGEALVEVAGNERGRLGPGDYFGEVAVIDQRERSATVTAATELRCHRLASSEFRRFAESDVRFTWPLLQAMAKRLRAAEGTADSRLPPPARAWPAD
jgi:CRP/FNR family transcriptional regulator, cyclic AMP receptor protein